MILRELMVEKQFMAWNAQAADDKCMDLKEQPRKHLTDRQAWEMIRRVSGCESTSEFQELERNKRATALRKILKRGVSIRQASRLTGISIGVIRKFAKG